MNRKIKEFFKYIIIIAVIFFKLPLPHKCIFRRPCPGCGLKRTMLCAIKFDFVGAFNYHPLFGVIGLEILYLIFKEKVSIGKNIEVTVLLLTIVLMAAVYFIRYFA